MKEIKAWETDDGEVFDNQEEAVAHQQYLDFFEDLERLMHDSFIPTYDLDHQDIFNFILNNKEKIKELLEKYPNMKKPSDY